MLSQQALTVFHMGDTDVAITIGQTSTNMLGESGAVFGLVLLLLLLFSLLLICVGVCVCRGGGG